MKHVNLLFIILFFSLLAQSCRENIDREEVTIPNIPAVIKVQGSIHGQVTDNQGNIVSGAMVDLGSESTITDENGVFQFLDQKMNKNGAFVTVEKDGFFKGSRRFYPTAGRTSRINIELVSIKVIGSFSSGNESSISHEGLVLDFPKDAIVDGNGEDYIGVVNIAVAYINPTDINSLDQMPGDLTGISNEDELVALKSIGMIAVELMDASGNELQIKDGQLVDVKIPIPDDLQGGGPSSIPMWYFNEDTDIWEEEGFADLVGSSYETKLGHFSFWNCAIPSDYAFVEGSILNKDIPMQGITIAVFDEENNTSGYGVTNDNGMFRAYVPRGEELVLKVYNVCGEEIYSVTFTADEDFVILDPINLNLFSNLFIISGTVSNCEGELSPNAYIKINHGMQTLTYTVSDDGSFFGYISNCNGTESITISALDPGLGIYSGRFEYTIEDDLIVGNIELCAAEDLKQFIIIEYGEVKRDFVLDDLLSIHLNVQENLSGEPFYVLTIQFEVAPDSSIVNRIYSVDASPQDQVTFVDILESGFRAEGSPTDEILFQNGKEYLKISGVFTEIYNLAGQTHDKGITFLNLDVLLEI